MAKVPPGPGQTEEVVTHRRILNENPNQSQPETPRPPFWEYVAKLTPEQWKQHIIYLYRGPVRGGKYIAKYASAITPDMIAERHGGGDYTFLLNRGSEMLIKEEFSAEGPPIIGTQPPAGNGDGSSHSDLALVLNRLVDLIERRDAPRGSESMVGLLTEAARGGMDIQRTAYTQAANTLAANAGGPSPIQTPEARMTEMMQFFKMAKDIFAPAASGNSVEEVVKTIGALRTAGLIGAGDSKTTWGMELVRQLPSAFTQLGGMFENLKQIEALKVRGVEISRGVPPAAATRVNPAPIAAAAETGAAPAEAAPASAAAGAGGRSETQTLIESAIARIVMDPKLSLDQAVEEAVIYLDRSDETLVNRFVSVGESGMLVYCQQSPVLSQVPLDRLQAFIAHFMKTLTNPEAESTPILVPTPPGADAGTVAATSA